MFDAMTFFHRTRVSKVAIQRGLPTAFNFRQYADAAGCSLLARIWRTCIASRRDISSRSSRAKRPVIPMEQPTHFEPVINLKTAQAIGVYAARSAHSRQRRD